MGPGISEFLYLFRFSDIALVNEFEIITVKKFLFKKDKNFTASHSIVEGSSSNCFLSHFTFYVIKNISRSELLVE
jgi:hypothetical protein